MRSPIGLCLAILAVSTRSQPHARAPAYTRFQQLDTVDAHLHELRAFATALLSASQRSNERCFVIITDDLHLAVYDHTFFRHATASTSTLRAYYVLRVAAHGGGGDGIISFQHLFGTTAWHRLNIRQCNLHFITISNGLDVKRLLHFVYGERILNVHGRFVMLHDARLLELDMWPIWCNMLSTIFLQHTDTNRLRISVIPFPNILHGVVITKTVQQWQMGRRIQLDRIFSSTASLSNLQGIRLPVAISEHVPMVMRSDAAYRQRQRNASNGHAHYMGLEVNIVRALGVVMNFQPIFYAPMRYDGEENVMDERIQSKPPSTVNGSYTTLLSELMNYRAIFGIGDLHPYELHRNQIDLSWPHSSECLTFLTPESSRDDNWRTLLQPFSISMWSCVLLSLALVGTIFYVISYLNNRAQQHDHGHAVMNAGMFFRCLRRRRTCTALRIGDAQRISLRMFLNRRPMPLQQHQKADLFESYSNCILLTYSMLLNVALPGMPCYWPLRVLTGWFWVYCILVTVIYRASLTAILANPAARVTIDSLEDLKRSHVTATVGIVEDKQLFDNAVDDLARTIGQRIEVISDIYSVTERIAKENFAYYDNMYLLRHLRFDDDQQRDGAEVLHIMHECVVQMPVVIGMVKNSVLKSRVDILLQYLSESGLLNKWLADVTQNLNAVEKPPQEALMNLSKIWSSFVALTVGLLLAVCTIIGEQLHYRYIVRKHPLYDEYNRNFYYNFKHHMQNTTLTQFRV